MVILKDISQFLKRYDSLVLSIGNFDGVHLGHQRLLKKVISHAEEIGSTSGVLIFYPHPLSVLPGKKCPPFLSTLREKEEVFASIGLEILLCQRFSMGLANKTAGEFVQEFLCEKLRSRVIVVGHDYSFGKNREGNKAFLENAGEKCGFRVVEADALKLSGGVVSSTRIRNSLHKGDIEDASLCLGRAYSISGKVSFGDKKGECLGIKTAKVLPSKGKLIPKKGVYIVKVFFDKKVFSGVLNVGNQPTFGDYALAIEVHILNFSGDIYQKSIKIDFLKRIREEKKFQNIEDLKRQIEADIKATREYFEDGSKEG